MKKFFSLFAAICLAFAANAAVINIDNTTSDALRHALASANAGDEIVMAAGTYLETNGNYLAFNKNITVRAAEGAEVIVMPQVSATISGGSRVEIIGIKWDASHLRDSAAWYEHVFYASDATAGNCIKFENCEFYNFNYNNSLIFCSASNKLDSVAVNNCYIHDINKSFMYFENPDMGGVKVTNSTFANVAMGSSTSYYAGNIFTKAELTTVNVLVDHCTFYNIEAMNTDYGAVKVKGSPNAIVSNCIFMMPASYSGGRAVYNMGGQVFNCLTYNYTKDSNTGLHSGPTITNCIQADPLFVAAATCDFTLGTGSPALTAATDGGAIGDPRWAPAAAIEYDTIYCKVIGDWWKYDAQGGLNAVGAYAWGEGLSQNAEWPGVIMEPVAGENYTWSVAIDSRYTNIIFTRITAAGSYEGIKTSDLTIPTDGKNLYTITKATYDWGNYQEMLAPTDGEWSVFAPAVSTLENGYYLMGIVGGDSTATWTIADLNSSRKLEVNQANTAEYQISVTLAVGDQLQVVEVANDAITNWFPGGEGLNFVIDAAHAGEKTIYFRPDRQGASDWWQGCIYIAPNSSSAIDALGADAKAVKVIENGRIYIIRDGVRFNILGAQE